MTMKKQTKSKKLIKKEVSEFKKFIDRGNVVDLSIGVLMGTAFSKIVSSVVDDLLMPVIGIIIGGLDFSNIKFKVGDASIQIGNFIQSVVDFLIVALCIFIFVKIISHLTKKTEEEKQPEKSEEVQLLEEIRDLLKNKNE